MEPLLQAKKLTSVIMDVVQTSNKIRILQMKIDSCIREAGLTNDPAVKSAFAVIQAYHTTALSVLTAQVKQDLAKTVSGTS